jgi:hypothetical protein
VRTQFLHRSTPGPSAAPEVGLRPLAVISQDVAGGISYAATLIGRKEPPNFPYDGVIVEGGSILGGYYCGASRCRSSVLPESLVLSVPKDHVANAVALCSRLAGKVEVLETDSRIYLRTPNIEGSWNRIDQRSSDLLNKPQSHRASAGTSAFVGLPLPTGIPERTPNLHLH